MTYDLRSSELEAWLNKSEQGLDSFFGKSGVRYKELGLKDRMPSMTDEEKKELLVSDNRLLKRPIVVTDDVVLVGFREADWENKLLK